MNNFCIENVYRLNEDGANQSYVAIWRNAFVDESKDDLRRNEKERS